MAAVQRQAETSKSSAPQAATARRDAATTDSPSSAAWSARTTVLLSTRTQAAPLAISSPGDAAEHEAETLAHRVVSMPPPASAPHLSRGSPLAARAPAAAPASGGDQAQTTAATADAIQAELGGGAPLPKAVQDFMAPRFKADFSSVRIHTDAKAENLATRLGAKAFTYGRHVFFNRGQFQPASKAGKELIAHELAHTIQQSATVQRQVDTTVSQRAQPQVQRGIISEALDWFADKANYIPGFRLITVVIGINPINMSRVERSAANILRALVEFLPGGGLIVEALDRYGIFDKAGSWIESQIASLGIGLGSIKAALDAFVNGLGLADAFRLGAVWERAKRIFTEPIDRLISFAKSLVSAVLDLIKEAILKPLAALAARTPGWDLLKAVLGRDPITGEAVPRTADTLIGGFMKLIGQEEIWENIKRANAIARAWAWFQSAISGLMALVTSIPERFMSTLRSLEIMDLVLPPRALLKVAGAFASFMGDFLSWAGGTVMDLLKIIMEVVAPGVMPYVKKAAGAFDTIIRNPIGFVGTLVQAGKLGFSNFAKNFLTHLRASLVGWLTGAMTGAAVYIPQGFSLREILKFALSVLGLTWTNIRTKLVAATNETVVRALETGFDIVVTLVTEGPAAAWQKILETLSNLRDMVIEQVMTFVKDRIVSAAVTRLLSMLSPAGAFIQAIIAIYNTVMFFVERLRQIAAVAASFIDAIATIAAGNIAPAAARVESTLAGLLTLVISFLARIAGLGRVADAVTNIINRIRAPINNALDRVVAWIVTQARRLGRFVAQAGVPHDPAERLRLASAAAIGAARRLRGRVTAGLLTPILAGIRTRYGLVSIQPYESRGSWWVRARINPEVTANLGVSTGLVGPDGRTPAADYRGAGGGARAAEGPNWAPIISKLGQAITMFTGWAGRGSSPVAQQMLRGLEQAREQAQSLSQDQARGVPESARQPRMTRLANEFTRIQALAPGYELVSIGQMSVTVNSARRQMPVARPTPWNIPVSAVRAEYQRQLREQQDGINAMTVAQMLANNQAFVDHGRGPDEAALRQMFQTRGGNVAGHDAPHNPDIGWGLGFPDPTGAIAISGVNRSIGSQGGRKRPQMLGFLNAVSPLTRAITQANFELRAV